MPPLVSPWNEFQGTSTEIQYWWHITIQIRVVLVIGWSKFPMQQDQSEALQYGVSTLVSQTSFHGENQMTAVFSGYVRWYQLCTKELLISYSASSKSGQIQFLTLYLQSLEHHILVIILQRGEVIMSCCHGSKIFWMTTNQKIKSSEHSTSRSVGSDGNSPQLTTIFPEDAMSRSEVSDGSAPQLTSSLPSCVNNTASPHGLWVNSPFGIRPHGLLTQSQFGLEE